MKMCSCCGLEKLARDYQKRAASRDGLTASCKACLSSRDKARESPERASARRAYQMSEAGKIAHARAIKKYNERYPMRRYSRVIVGNALQNGSLVKPEICETCSSSRKIEAHHDDYTKPLNVRWLCEDCHKEWHRHNDPVYGVESDLNHEHHNDN